MGPESAYHPPRTRRGIRTVQKTVLTADRVIGRATRWVRSRLGINIPTTIVPYRGFANGRRAWVTGRVLADLPPVPPQLTHTAWDNLRSTWRRWSTNEIPRLRVTATLDGLGEAGRQSAVTDDDGYFDFVFELPRPLPDGRLWHPLQLDVPANGRSPAISATGQVMRPPAQARLAVVSDLDDTVIYTAINDLLTAARLTFFQNALTRKPFEGVRELYEAFQHGPGGPAASQQNPIFYVSNSAWNLYDLLVDFLAYNEIPAGPVLLRDVGLTSVDRAQSGFRHKLGTLHTLLGAYPHLPFVLIGDSGQADPLVYLEAIRTYGSRIRAVYIRQVHEGDDLPENRRTRGAAAEAARLGVPMQLIPDSAAAAEHAAALGLIDAAALPAIRHARRRDHLDNLAAQ